jgi:hypothetical protein|tara:strand:- start:988 stop:1599 length:612 start_codon:yes stop_codon:yes gene_type:complete
MTAILDRIQSVRNKLDSFENIDQAKDYFSTISYDDYLALKIFLKCWKNLKLFIAERNDVDDDLMIWLEILGIYLTVPDEDRKSESKEKIKTRKEKYESTIKTYQQVKEDPVLKDFLIKDLELFKKLLVNQRMLIELKNKRVRDLTEIKRYLKPIVKNLKERGWNKTQQTDFLYDLFCSFNYENCRNIDPESYKKKLWMTIHRL